MRITTFKRSLYKDMLQWKTNRKGSTALLIKGARRVGKSTLVRTLASQGLRMLKKYKTFAIHHSPTKNERRTNLAQVKPSRNNGSQVKPYSKQCRIEIRHCGICYSKSISL